MDGAGLLFAGTVEDEQSEVVVIPPQAVNARQEEETTQVDHREEASRIQQEQEETRLQIEEETPPKVDVRAALARVAGANPVTTPPSQSPRRD